MVEQDERERKKKEKEGEGEREREKDKKQAGKMGIAKRLIRVDEKTRKRSASSDRSLVHLAVFRCFIQGPPVQICDPFPLHFQIDDILLRVTSNTRLVHESCVTLLCYDKRFPLDILKCKYNNELQGIYLTFSGH